MLNQFEMYAILDRSDEGVLNRLLIRVQHYGKLLSPHFQDALTLELQDRHEKYINAVIKQPKLT
jgi:hypothetical protein